MNLRTFLAVNVAVMATLAGARGETSDFLGSATASWKTYAGATAVPSLFTTAPGRIVDATSSGSSYGRLDTAFSIYPGSWQPGDKFTFRMDGVISNSTTFRAEFTDAAHAVALQLVMVNGAANNADIVQINALGGTSALLFQGNLGGVAGSPQRLLADLTLTIQPGGNTAMLSGSLTDSVGSLWGGTTPTINLGVAPAALYAGLNVNASGGVSGINLLNWTVALVPEPSTAALLTMAGLAAMAFGRRLGRNR